MRRAEEFFAYARERHAIHLRRRFGQKWPWTEDPILQRFKFTNVFRELDRTTIWFRENVREPLRSSPDVLLATVLFRWFNRITTGEAIFCQYSDLVGGSGATVWDMRGLPVSEWMKYLESSIKNYCGRGPYVTGAYMIKSPTGMDKLSGILELIKRFMEDQRLCRYTDSMRGVWDLAVTYDKVALRMLEEQFTLEDTWRWLRQFDHQGDFLAYEVVTDLRHTDLLCGAPDIMTWANVGPGAMRGLNRLQSRGLISSEGMSGGRFHDEMRKLLELSRSSEFWPCPLLEEKEPTFIVGDVGEEETVPRDQRTWDDWPVWEMRDVEHTLCEFDKYERVRLGEGRPRGVYRRDS